MVRPLKLRAKFALFYAALFTVLLGSGGFAVYQIMHRELIAAADDNLVDHCAGLWGYIHFHEGKPVLVYDPRNREVSYFIGDATRYFQLYDAASGELLIESQDSSAMHLALPASDVQRLVSQPRIETSAQVEGLRFFSAVYRANDHPYLLRVGVSAEHDINDLAELRNALWLAFPIVTLLGALGAWWMAGQVLRPLQHLEWEARNIGINELNRRLPHRGTDDELDALADTFNQVLARLEKAVKGMRQFAGMMSHELRTPLTVLQGEAEVALRQPELSEPCREVLCSQLEEVSKLKRLVNTLLALARAEAGEIRLNKSNVDISAIALRLCDLMQPIAEERQISLQVSCSEPAVICGDEIWLERVAMNLLDNAMKFTPDGGTVDVTVSTAGDSAVVRVADTGMGIPEAICAQIFDPFYQARTPEQEHRGGAGLGLALAKWVIDAHAGTIQVASNEGKGSVFTVSFPLALSAVTPTEVPLQAHSVRTI